jgi:hypothetical protein
VLLSRSNAHCTEECAQKSESMSAEVLQEVIVLKTLG